MLPNVGKSHDPKRPMHGSSLNQNIIAAGSHSTQVMVNVSGDDIIASNQNQSDLAELDPVTLAIPGPSSSRVPMSSTDSQRPELYDVTTTVNRRAADNDSSIVSQVEMVPSIKDSHVYAPTDKHALDRHGVEKVLLVENTVERNINRRRGEGSLSVLDIIDANRRAGSRNVGTARGIGSEFITHGSSSGRGLSGASVEGKTSVSGIIRGSSIGLSRALSGDDDHFTSGSRIGSSGLARNVDLSRNSHLETIGSSRGVSGHTGTDILDAISSGRGGRVVFRHRF
ncbi:E2.7.3.2 [Mytilus edulis]|uniref:E2.7.3.2 n=1 Tax=Mytilus edulis TaxID=6550 RepID=A0A8S3SNT6_MYTED|nr:E2.7.3.2 [Mytilus edulis]